MPDFGTDYVTVRPGETAMYEYPYDVYMKGSSLEYKGGTHSTVTLKVRVCFN